MSAVKRLVSPINQHIKQFLKAPAPQLLLAKTYNTHSSLNTRSTTHNNVVPLLGSSVCAKKNARWVHTSPHHHTPGASSPPFSSPCVNTETMSLEVTIGGRVLVIPLVWLRDHCRSPRCYNHETNQKNVDEDILGRDLTPASVTLTGGDKLGITWQDGHQSEFTSKWITDNFYPGGFSQVTQRVLWEAKDIQNNLPRVNYTDHMGTEEGLRSTLRNLLMYGFCMVDGTPASIETTQAVVERLTFVLETLFGGMWQFTSDASRSDTAYSVLGLGAHTDNTYMDLPAGIQVFHCLKHTGSGGDTLLVDGFKAADTLYREQPAAHATLARTVIPHEYKEPAGEHSPGYHLHSLGPVLRLHPGSGEMVQLRFNPYDRAPLNTVPPSDIPAFYEAYDMLSRTIARKEGELWVKLQPGTVIFIDNWRVMHGRSAFDGERRMCGCYLPRDEWVSKARTMGLL